MASGWNLWVWLQCIGVVSRCCCKDTSLQQHPLTTINILTIIVNFPYSTCIRFFWQQNNYKERDERTQNLIIYKTNTTDREIYA